MPTFLRTILAVDLLRFLQLCICIPMIFIGAALAAPGVGLVMLAVWLGPE